jgi:hypothetical protein
MFSQLDKQTKSVLTQSKWFSYSINNQSINQSLLNEIAILSHPLLNIE